MRACAPSCRLRSSRRRSVSPALTMRARDARSSSIRARSSAASRAFSSASAAAAPPRATSCGSSASERSWRIAAIRSPCSSTGVHSPVGQLHRPAVGVDEARRLREPVRERHRRVAERVGERRADRVRPRRLPDLRHQRREPVALREPAAQQPGEEAERDGRERAGSPARSSHVRARARRPRRRTAATAIEHERRPPVHKTGAMTRRCGPVAPRQRRTSSTVLVAMIGNTTDELQRRRAGPTASWSSTDDEQVARRPGDCSSNSSDGIWSTVAQTYPAPISSRSVRVCEAAGREREHEVPGDHREQRVERDADREQDVVVGGAEPDREPGEAGRGHQRARCGCRAAATTRTGRCR